MKTQEGYPEGIAFLRFAIFVLVDYKFLNAHISGGDGIFGEGDDNLALCVQIEGGICVNGFKLPKGIGFICAVTIAEEESVCICRHAFFNLRYDALIADGSTPAR